MESTSIHTASGSSPRPWGTPRSYPTPPTRQRFIPTPVGNTPRGRTGTRRASVHTHARGEHSVRSSLSASAAGSSPRPWGTPVVAVHGAPHPRFIPTPVGNTTCNSSSDGISPVHPHARGEHDDLGAQIAARDGSSPRPWGTPPGTVDAGDPRTVHPPARGEHAARMAVLSMMSGSSPRPWGTLVRRPRSRPCTAVHPHARGEHWRCRSSTCAAFGSSPRPWGTRRRGCRRRGPTRFIPTPVGNTPQQSRPAGLAPVHPHARGEHRAPHFRALVGERFIPTPVGNTIVVPRTTPTSTVHPHARGEHSWSPVLAVTTPGSSPRPWGTPLARP